MKRPELLTEVWVVFGFNIYAEPGAKPEFRFLRSKDGDKQMSGRVVKGVVTEHCSNPHMVTVLLEGRKKGESFYMSRVHESRPAAEDSLSQMVGACLRLMAGAGML